MKRDCLGLSLQTKVFLSAFDNCPNWSLASGEEIKLVLMSARVSTYDDASFQPHQATATQECPVVFKKSSQFEYNPT